MFSAIVVIFLSFIPLTGATDETAVSSKSIRLPGENTFEKHSRELQTLKASPFSKFVKKEILSVERLIVEGSMNLATYRLKDAGRILETLELLLQIINIRIENARLSFDIDNLKKRSEEIRLQIKAKKEQSEQLNAPKNQNDLETSGAEPTSNEPIISNGDAP